MFHRKLTNCTQKLQEEEELWMWNTAKQSSCSQDTRCQGIAETNSTARSGSWERHLQQNPRHIRKEQANKQHWKDLGYKQKKHHKEQGGKNKRSKTKGFMGRAQSVLNKKHPWSRLPTASFCLLLEDILGS